jgi:hypothetical protein
MNDEFVNAVRAHMRDLETTIAGMKVYSSANGELAVKRIARAADDLEGSLRKLKKVFEPVNVGDGIVRVCRVCGGTKGEWMAANLCIRCVGRVG